MIGHVKKIGAILALAAVLGAGAASANTQDFPSWLRALKAEAAQRGISQQVIAAALPDTLRPIESVLRLDNKQPEKTKTFAQYLEQAVNTTRVEQGRTRMLNYRATLDSVSRAYGVEPEVIVALWGVETNYGANTGGYDVVAALATLAYDGRRGAYFRGELMNALQIIDEGHISAAKMKGSWAGAMGQCQFMPSSFLKLAVDFNGDGKRDIWNTEADVFASAANYLAKSGWKAGQPWGHRVFVPPGIDRNLLNAKNIQSLQFWHDKGIRMMNGQPVPFKGVHQAAVIQPGGAGTDAYMVYGNYQVILKWNRSNYFATSVGLLSDRIKTR
jgi:membrane-bound lytic murein transglycosylase B